MNPMLWLVLAFHSIAGPTPGAVLCVVETPVVNTCVAGMTDRLVVFDGISGRVLHTVRETRGPVTAVAVDKSRNWLAIASGRAAENNQVDLYQMDRGGLPLRHITRLSGMVDQIYAMAFRPMGGDVLAAAGYGRKIHFWDLKSFKETLVVKDHSDAIRGIDWHPAGTRLASCACDRTVKVWEYPTGRCSNSLNESTDWLYCVQWTNGGRNILSGGVDRSLRMWEIGPAVNSLERSRFAHDGPIVGLGISGDSIITLGEDRFLKKWSRENLQLKGAVKVGAQPVSCLGISGKGDFAWVGGFDGVVRRIDLETLKVAAEFPNFKAPVIGQVDPEILPRGETTTAIVRGNDLDLADWTNVKFDAGSARFVEKGENGAWVRLAISVPGDAVPGVRNLVVPGGKAGNLEKPIRVVIGEREKGHGGTGSGSVHGKISRAGQVDRVFIPVLAGQTLGLLLEQEKGSNLDCLFSVRGPEGNMVAFRKRALGFKASRSGNLEIQVHDREFRVGAADYWLHSGDFQVCTGVVPTHIQPGTSATFRLLGVDPDKGGVVDISAPPGIASGQRVDLPTRWKGIPGATAPIAEPFPQVLSREVVHEPPFGASGILGPGIPGQVWKFKGRRGEKVVVDVMAGRIGSALDTFLEIRDAGDRPLVRALLQPVDQTSVVFRNHEPKSPGIRIEKWGGLAPNNYLYAGGDLMRIRALPRNPDDDCQFFSTSGKRLSWLGTTPTQHPIGQTLLKVIPRKPGEQIENSGWAPISLPWANDDGGPDAGTDSTLVFDPPVDGTYLAHVSSADERPGIDSAYHLTVRPAIPDFAFNLRGNEARIAPGGAAELLGDISRLDGWEGELKAETSGLGGGWIGSRGFASAMENSILLTVENKDPMAALPVNSARIKVSGMVGGKTVSREYPLPKITRVPAGDVSIRPELAELVLEPGKRTRLPIVIERAKGFDGRVPVDVRGLPQGVRVLDVGLNGILVPPGQTKRILEIEADSWVEPLSVPIVLTARREGKPEYVGQAVTIHIRKAGA